MKISIARAICFLVLIFFCFVSPASAKPIWEFEVPVIVKNLPKQVKYVVIKWIVMHGFGVNVLEGRKEVFISPDFNGNFSTTVKIVIDDTSIKDFSQASFFSASMELSEDGFTSFPPNASGIPWAKTKPGTKLEGWKIVEI